MPNPTPAKYTVQLGPTVTPEVAAELATWAEVLGWSTSGTAREALEEGLAHKRGEYASWVAVRDGITKAEVRARYDALYSKHLAEAAARGNRQVKRRRDYDDRTRTPIAAAGSAAVTAATPAKRVRSKRPAA